MPITVLEHIKGSELPTSWKKKTKLDPEQTFTITIKPENEEEDMPPEEMFREEFVEEAEKRCKAVKGGKTKIYTCKDEKETKALFNKWLNE